MAKNKVSEWSSTPANNTDIANIDIAEGCAPSGVNNAIREIMAQVKDMQTGADGDNFTVGNNLSVNNDSVFTGTVLVGETLTSVGVITASAGFSGNLTGNVTGNCSGTSLNVTGTVAVANGGTGLTTLTANNVMLGNGTSTPSFVAPSTNGNVLTSNGTTWVSSPKITSYTQVNASGTAIDFTGIPSWAKRVTVIFNNVSTNSDSIIQVQLGTSSGFLTTGYSYTCTGFSVAALATATASTGFIINNGVADSSNILSGNLIITNITNNTWVGSHSVQARSFGSAMGGGSIGLSSNLDRIRITTVNGTDTFDAGAINIMYE